MRSARWLRGVGAWIRQLAVDRSAAATGVPQVSQKRAVDGSRCGRRAQPLERPSAGSQNLACARSVPARGARWLGTLHPSSLAGERSYCKARFAPRKRGRFGDRLPRRNARLDLRFCTSRQSGDGGEDRGVEDQPLRNSGRYDRYSLAFDPRQDFRHAERPSARKRRLSSAGSGAPRALPRRSERAVRSRRVARTQPPYFYLPLSPRRAAPRPDDLRAGSSRRPWRHCPARRSCTRCASRSLRAASVQAPYAEAESALVIAEQREGEVELLRECRVRRFLVEARAEDRDVLSRTVGLDHGASLPSIVQPGVSASGRTTAGLAPTEIAQRDGLPSWVFDVKSGSGLARSACDTSVSLA